MIWDHKTQSNVMPSKYEILSTMGNLDFRYVKDNHLIMWGLNEHKKPPTLIWPRPLSLVDKELRDGEVHWMDDPMNRVLQKYSNEEIYNDILNARP